jgi:hypothetical protein
MTQPTMPTTLNKGDRLLLEPNFAMHGDKRSMTSWTSVYGSMLVT